MIINAIAFGHVWNKRLKIVTTIDNSDCIVPASWLIKLGLAMANCGFNKNSITPFLKRCHSRTSKHGQRCWDLAIDRRVIMQAMVSAHFFWHRDRPQLPGWWSGAPSQRYALSTNCSSHIWVKLYIYILKNTHIHEYIKLPSSTIHNSYSTSLT